MRTITNSLFGSPGRSGMSAPALVTFASAIVALVVLALSATTAQSSERHNGKAVELSGKTWLKIDKDTAAALSDAGVKVEATGAAVGPTDERPYTFAFPIVGGKVDKDPLGGRIVHSGGLSFSADSEKVVVKRFVIELDRGVLSAKVAGTGQRIDLLRLGAPEDVKVGSERIVLKGVDAKLTSQAAKALNEAFDTELFAGGRLIGEATVTAKIDDDNGKDNNDGKGDDWNDDKGDDNNDD
ncbi:MAG TPA: hypothetical protein VK902_04250 [Rubrobacter sp.]|nr:hypothetical protein [Rubrobacter sp.]